MSSLSESIGRRLAYRHRLRTQRAQATELLLCRADPVHWVNHWVWTYDPREPGTALPFDLYPVQARLLNWPSDRERTRTNGLASARGHYRRHGRVQAGGWQRARQQDGADLRRPGAAATAAIEVRQGVDRNPAAGARAGELPRQDHALHQRDPQHP